MNIVIKHFASLLIPAALLASCSDSMENAETFLNGNSKTPIAVQTNLSGAPLTRAFDKTFESGDKLFAYIEAGKVTDGNFAYEEQFVWKGDFVLTKQVTTSTGDGVGNITSTTADGDLDKTLYWDDFSSAEYDLRKDGRGIRLKYGYCYNGGEANASNNTTDEQIKAGTLTWTIPADQSTAEAMKQSDLLYAATQDMITYGHDPASRGTLMLPYTHAMSKVTINVSTGVGFATTKENFSSSVLTLKNMQVKADVNAPNAIVTAVSPDGTSDITTYNLSKENTTATYQAIVCPTSLTEGNILATITNIDGNDYDIKITEDILSGWNVESNAYTKTGTHYVLDVNVSKQQITVRATITDWTNVETDGTAAINFTSDITETGTIADELKANGFDVYKSSTNSGFTTSSTTVTYADSKWNYSPAIYWNGQSDASYFRAISPASASNTALNQGTDLIWGTSGNTAINPRTGDVHLDFQHLMSKLCVKLETTSDAAAVNLEGATIKITNLATSGSYSIVDASVSAGEVVEMMLSGKSSGFEEYVVPQTIGNDATVVITLADGTTYSLSLNKCKDEGETAVAQWTKGKSYTYTIHLNKETQTFRALVKNWEEATGNGEATLDWD